MFEGIEYRGYGQAIVEELPLHARVAGVERPDERVPPTQILADLLTLREHFGSLQGLNLGYMGDARYNMGNNLMIGCAKMGPILWPVRRSLLAEPRACCPLRGVCTPERRQRHPDRGHRCRSRGRCRLHRCVGQHGRAGGPPWEERINALAPPIRSTPR